MTQFNKDSNKLPIQLDHGLNVTRKVIGGKWKPSIIASIAKGIQDPIAIQQAIQHASLGVIKQQLRELLAFEVLELQSQYNASEAKLFQLSEFGNSLLPLVEAMREWGDMHALEVTQLIRIKGIKT